VGSSSPRHLGDEEPGYVHVHLAVGHLDDGIVSAEHLVPVVRDSRRSVDGSQELRHLEHGIFF